MNVSTVEENSEKNFSLEAKTIFKLLNLDDEILGNLFEKKLQVSEKDKENLKQRKNIKSDEEKNKNKENINTSHKEEVKELNEPLKWFGVLVPQSLRQSQTSFEKAANLSCQIVQSQQRILELVKNYKAARTMKEQLACSV